MTKLCILFGGRSSEHEVSLVSAYGVLKNVDRERFDVIPVGITKDGIWYLFSGDLELIKSGEWSHDSEHLERVAVDPAPDVGGFIVFDRDGAPRRMEVDVVFPVLHGANGEDGTVQGLLEVAGIPFVGSDHTSSGVCMDKSFTKCIVSETCRVRQANALILLKRKYEADPHRAIQMVRELGYPVFVKPSRAGSSVGVTKVKAEAALADAIGRAFCEDDKILVEEFIDGREIEVAVMEREGEVVTSEPGEIDPGFEFYDYDTKYQNDTASYYIPARLSSTLSEKVKAFARKIFLALDCKTLARVDFFVTKDEDVVFNEINTIPGFTPISMYPKLFINSGMTYTDIITELVTSALKKK